MNDEHRRPFVLLRLGTGCPEKGNEAWRLLSNMRDAVTGGYGANTIVTRVEVGAGERMVDRGLIQIYRLLGRLKDKPEQP